MRRYYGETQLRATIPGPATGNHVRVGIAVAKILFGTGRRLPFNNRCLRSGLSSAASGATRGMRSRDAV